MALKNLTCTTPETWQATRTDPDTQKVIPAAVCAGTIIPYENTSIIVAGVTYTRYEKCTRCGKIYPG